MTTYDDLLAVPDHLVAEIIDGELHTSPRPAPRHTRSHTRLVMALAPFDRDVSPPGCWIILTEPELHFGNDVLVPDLAGWRRERMPALPEAAFFTLAPDWICEVLSPSTVTLDRTKKLRIYARERIPHAWLIDPIARTLEVMVLGGMRWTTTALHRDDESVRAVPFDAVEIALPLLWEL